MVRQPERLVYAGGAIAMLVAVVLPSWWAYERSGPWVLIGILWPMIVSMTSALAASIHLGNVGFGVIAGLIHVPVSIVTFIPGVFFLGPGFSAAMNVAVTGLVLWRGPSRVQRALIVFGLLLCALSVTFTSGLIYNLIDGPATPVVGSLIHAVSALTFGCLAAWSQSDSSHEEART